MIAAIVEAILGLFAAVIEAIAGFFVAGADVLGAGEIIAIVLLFWAFYGVFELLRALLQRRKPRPVSRPIIWRPAKLRLKRQSDPGGDAATSQRVASAQPNEK